MHDPFSPDMPHVPTSFPVRGNLLATVLDHSPEACFVLDDARTIQYANRAFLESRGWSIAKTLGATLPQIGFPAEENLRRALEGREVVQFESFDAGRRRWYDVTAKPIPYGLAVFLRDVTDERRAREEVPTSEIRFRELMEQSPWSIQILSPYGKTLWVNRSFERLWGLTLEDLAAYNMLDDPQLEAIGVLPFLRKALDGEFVLIPEAEYDARRMAADAKKKRVRGLAYPILDGEGRVVEVVMTHEDVTDLAAAERRLHESETHLHLALQSAEAGTWEWDLRTDVIHWSEKMYDILDQDPSMRPTRDTLVEHIHEGDRERAEAALAEALRTCGSVSAELRISLPRKGLRWVAAIARVMPGANGGAEKVIGILFDITERKRVSERMELLVDSMPQIAWWLDEKGKLVNLNRRYREYSGIETISPEEAWNAVVHPDDIEAVRERYQTCIQSGEVWEDELRLRNRNGEYRWHLSRLVPVNDEDGTHICWFGTSTDIHTQKEAEAELERRVRKRTAELEAANVEMEGFTYTVSHDLRTPLRAIIATSSILLDDALPRLTEEEQALLLRQAHNAKRLGVLIDELLKLSRIGRQRMASVEVDLSAIASEVARELTNGDLAPEPMRRATYCLDIEPGLKATGDAQLLRFVLQNLLDNSMKFCGARGHIQFGKNDRGEFFVRDDGIGFDPKYAEKLFLPFERLVLESQYPGTGIGLANVKRIVERHGGYVRAEGTPGEGATIFFTLGNG